MLAVDDVGTANGSMQFLYTNKIHSVNNSYINCMCNMIVLVDFL